MLDTPANTPGTVLVTFPRADSSTPLLPGRGRDFARQALANGLDAEWCVPTKGSVYAISVSLATGNSAVKILASSAMANFAVATDSTPINDSELQLLATRIAQDFYNWRFASLEIRYASLVPWIADGMHDIEYTHSAAGLFTNLHRSEWEPEFGELLHTGQFGSSDSERLPIADAVSIVNGTPYGTAPNLYYDAVLLSRDNAGAAWTTRTPVWVLDHSGATSLDADSEWSCHSAGVEASGPVFVNVTSANSQPPSADWVTQDGDTTAYDNTATYSLGMTVTSGDTYLYINASPASGNDPPNATYWLLLPGGLLTLGVWNSEATEAVGATVQVARPLYLIQSGGGGGGGGGGLFGIVAFGCDVTDNNLDQIALFISAIGSNATTASFVIPVVSSTFSVTVASLGSIGDGEKATITDGTSTITATVTSLAEASSVITATFSVTAILAGMAGDTMGSGATIRATNATEIIDVADASTTQRGVVTTLAQSFAGVKTFTNDVDVTSGGSLSVSGGGDIGCTTTITAAGDVYSSGGDVVAFGSVFAANGAVGFSTDTHSGAQVNVFSGSTILTYWTMDYSGSGAIIGYNGALFSFVDLSATLSGTITDPTLYPAFVIGYENGSLLEYIGIWTLDGSNLPTTNPLGIQVCGGLVTALPDTIPATQLDGQVPLANGGTEADLSATGPGAVVQVTMGGDLTIDAPLRLDFGGTGADFSATGPGVVVQASTGAALTVVTTLPAVDGSALTNLNASSIISGTLPDAQLSANVPIMASGVLPAVDGSLLTGLTSTQISGLAASATTDTTDATNITSGTLPDAQLSVNVTLQGNTFNGVSELVQLDSSGKMPAVDGSALTNLTGGNVLYVAGGETWNGSPPADVNTAIQRLCASINAIVAWANAQIPPAGLSNP